MRLSNLKHGDCFKRENDYFIVLGDAYDTTLMEIIVEVQSARYGSMSTFFGWLNVDIVSEQEFIKHDIGRA